MIFKIKTSKKTMNLFEELTASTSYAPFILAKLAISMSLKSKKPLNESDFNTDSLGLELNRQTITGEWDDLFKVLIKMFEEKNLDDDNYFQKYLKAHLDRGTQILYSEYKYKGDFLEAIMSEEDSI